MNDLSERAYKLSLEVECISCPKDNINPETGNPYPWGMPGEPCATIAYKGYHDPISGTQWVASEGAHMHRTLMALLKRIEKLETKLEEKET